MQVKRTIIFLTFLSLYSTVFPQESKDHTLFEQAGYTFPYQLSRPDNSWKLHKKLVEISGLSYVDKYRIACVQDEKGRIYIFNIKKGEIETKTDFGDKGDYEGIEIVGNDAWVLKSNGTLYRVKDFLKEKDTKVIKYNTALSGRNNAEGLTYDPIGRVLLIVCKGYPFIDNDKEYEAKEFKAVYGFDLKTKKLNTTPFLLIELDSIKKYKNYNAMTSMGIELLAFFDASEGDVSFQPSGIAIHPLTGNIYVLASVGKTLAVFSEKSKMLALIQLESKIHKQPEGISFSPDGTLYISNEGDDGKGVILKFEEKIRK